MYWTGTDVQRLQRSFGLRENEQTRSGRTLPFGDEPERNSSVSATFNVRGLSLPDQTRISQCGAILIGCSYLFIARW